MSLPKIALWANQEAKRTSGDVGDDDEEFVAGSG